MRKIFALAALVLGLAACQTEPEGLDVNFGGEVETVINVTIPESETRAMDSEQGVFSTDILSGDATMRYILEIYHNGELAKERQVLYSDGKTMAFPVRLVPGRAYDFVVWADVVTAEGAGDNHYNTINGLTEVTLNGDWKAMDETRDAFTGVMSVAQFSNSTNITFDLTRPFAKLRVRATDIEDVVKLGITPSTAIVEYTTDHRQSFNARTKEYATADLADVKHTVTYATMAYEDVATAETYTLFADYFFADNDIVNFTLDVKDAADNTIGEKLTFNTDINVKRNYLTTIQGNLLTDANNVNVEIKPGFDAEIPETLEAELIAAAAAGGKVVLTDNVELTNPLIVTGALELDLNGYTIKGGEEYVSGLTGADISAIVVDGGSLVIDGNGTVEGATYGVYAKNGTLTIKDGEFKAITSAVQVAKATVNIEGGVFSVSGDDKRYVINCLDADYRNGDAVVVISGGEFRKFNPANNPAEGNGTNFVKAGLGTAVRGEYYVVVPEIVAILDAVESDTEVELTEDLAVASNTTIHTQTATAPITINGNGNSIVSSAESVDDFQWVGGTIPAMSTIFSSADGSLVTVNNLTFEGTMSALMLGHYQNATYNNYNTVLNNVNVINTEVVSFSSNIAPAVCVYGTATLNNCNIYGTTLSELDTDPMWPVYDLAAVNYSNTTLNNSNIGKIIFWNQAALIVNDGSVVEELVILGNMNNGNANNYININAGAEVKVIDLSKITDRNRVKINIEAGANVGKIVANGVEYASIEDYKNDQPIVEVATDDALTDAIKNGATSIMLASGNYTMPTDVNLQRKTLTITGTKETIIDCSTVDARNQFVTGATLKFDGVTLNFGKVNYMGFANTAMLTYKDCQINGLQFLYGPEVNFENCDLNSNGAEHTVWTYGAQNVNFTNCDLTYGDRGVNCYNDNDVQGGKQTVNFTKCTFSTNNTESEGAVEINSYFFSVGIEVNLDDCTAPEYGEMAWVSRWDSNNGAKTTINIR